MRKILPSIVVIASLGFTQFNAAQQAKPSNPARDVVAPDAAVVTVKGLCAEKSNDASHPCQTIVTRAQFEKLVDAIQPNMDEQSKQQLARAYPQFLILAREAQQRGLEKSPHFEERMNFARLQILSQELTRQLQEEAANVPDAEIEAYYQKNAPDYQVENLERIIIPLVGEKNKASADDMKKEAESLRKRAAAGEDFSKLQREAYDAAGVSGDTAPSPALHDMRRHSLPPAQSSAFDLKPGEVSPVINDATGHYIYKVDSQSMVPLQKVRQEIWTTLRQQRYRKMIESVQQPFGSDINTAYFGAEQHGED